MILAISIWGGSPNFQNLLVLFLEEGETKAWAGGSGKEFGKDAR